MLARLVTGQMSRGQRRGATRRSLSVEPDAPDRDRADGTRSDDDYAPPADDEALAESVAPVEEVDALDAAGGSAEPPDQLTLAVDAAAGASTGNGGAFGARRAALPNPLTARAFEREEAEGVAPAEDKKGYDAFVAQRAKAIQQLRNKQGQTPFTEKRSKTHWDHVLEEMEYISKEFTRSGVQPTECRMPSYAVASTLLQMCPVTQ